MNVATKSNAESLSPPPWAPETPRPRKCIEDLTMRAAGRFAVGLRTLFGSRAGGALGILTYHRTADPIRGLPKPLHNVTPRRFRQQLAGLLDRGFQFWPLTKTLEHWDQGTPVPPRTIVVTFDDGFETVYRHAWPVLQELRVPATVFLNTAYLGSTDPFPFDAWGMKFRDSAPAESYRPLSLEQCRRMARQGLVDFGAHTHTHQDFRGQPQAFQRDLQVSVDIVASLFDQAQVTFAFPYGSPYLGFAGGELAAAARRSGVVCALTTEPVLVPPQCDPFHWGRFNAFEWDTAATLAAKVEGWYSWAPQWRKRAARAVGAILRGRGAGSIEPRATRAKDSARSSASAIGVSAISDDRVSIGTGGPS